MARLYDKILAENWVRPKDRDDLRRATVISADQVTEYYYAINDKERWNLTDFPNLAPPFTNFFIETKMASKINSRVWGEREWFQPADEHMLRTEGMSEDRIVIYLERCKRDGNKDLRRPLRWGIHLRVVDKQQINRFSNFKFSDLEMLDVKWMCYGLLYVEWSMQGEMIQRPVWDYVYGIQKNGSICETGKEDGDCVGIDGPTVEHTNHIDRAFPASEARTVYMKMLRAEMQNHLNPLLLAITFMHCKNIEIKNESPDRKLAKRSAERGRPLCSYKIIDIIPLKKMLKREGTNEGTGIKMALHRCRGHFKTFTVDAPLLGKAVGTFFWAEQLRGNKQKGVIASDYQVEKPDGSNNV